MSDYASKKLDDILSLEAELEQKQFNPADHTTQPTNEKFGLATYEAKELEVTELTSEQDIEDQELARASIRNVLKISNKNLEGIFELARASEHPRAFSIAVEMSKSIVESSMKLNELVTKKEVPTKGTSPNSVTNNQQVNQHFYGSTEEAFRELRKAKESRISQEIDNPEN